MNPSGHTQRQKLQRPGALADPWKRRERVGTGKKGSLGPHSQLWVFLGHLQGELDTGAGTLGFEMTVSRAA